MPHIVFHGLRSGSEDFEADNIEKIETAILQGITEIQELELDSKGVSFSFVHDPTLISEAAPIIVFVEGLFEKPNRTIEVRQRLANVIRDAIVSIVREWRTVTKVEVFVKRFNPDKDGFSCYP
jgi:hypothetical protein